jgi:HSP20 family protein
MSIMRRPASPFGELLSLRQAMDRLFEDSFVRPRTWLAGELTGGMPLDIYTTSDALVIKAALPGVKPEDVDITIEGNTLTISGKYEDERREADEGGYLYQELSKGSCGRTVTLPADLDPEKAAAAFEHGVLRLTFPRSEAAKPRQIKITTGEVTTGEVTTGQAKQVPASGTSEQG